MRRTAISSAGHELSVRPSEPSQCNRRWGGAVPLSRLPIQHPPEQSIYRRWRIAQRHILRTPASRIPTLPALPPLLIFFKAPRTTRISPTATRTQCRDPVVIRPAVPAIFTARHTRFRLPQSATPSRSLPLPAGRGVGKRQRRRYRPRAQQQTPLRPLTRRRQPTTAAAAQQSASAGPAYPKSVSNTAPNSAA